MEALKYNRVSVDMTHEEYQDFIDIITKRREKYDVFHFLDGFKSTLKDLKPIGVYAEMKHETQMELLDKLILGVIGLGSNTKEKESQKNGK